MNQLVPESAEEVVSALGIFCGASVKMICGMYSFSVIRIIWSVDKAHGSMCETFINQCGYYRILVVGGIISNKTIESILLRLTNRNLVTVRAYLI